MMEPKSSALFLFFRREYGIILSNWIEPLDFMYLERMNVYSLRS